MQNDIDFEDQKPESEFDLVQMVRNLWKARKFIIKWTGIGIIAGLVIAFSIPKEYKSSIIIAPEFNDSSSDAVGGLSSLAAMAGININSSIDAISPLIYPDILSTEQFNVGLFDVMVTTKKDKTETVRQFLEKDTRATWWSKCVSVPLKWLGKTIKYLKGEKSETGPGHVTDPYRLTPEEALVVRVLSQCIKSSVDNKTGVITVSVTMQDPVVATMLADSVVERLKDFVTDYRTTKARNDLEYIQMLNDKARKEYYRAQRAYADYIDRNHNITLQSRQVESERLQNEADLAFSIYNQTAQQLQLAEAKVQELLPVYTVIKPASVPVKASSPSKIMILFVFAFLGFALSSFWVLYGRDTWRRLRAK